VFHFDATWLAGRLRFGHAVAELERENKADAGLELAAAGAVDTGGAVAEGKAGFKASKNPLPPCDSDQLDR